MTAAAVAPAVRERPILFSGWKVRAILAGAWMTRRVVKPQPPPECSIHYMLGNEPWLDEEHRTPLRHSWEAWHGDLFANRPEGHLCGSHSVRCPYGQPGDRLWVREAFRGPGHIGNGDDGVIGYGVEYVADGAYWLTGDCDCDGPCSGVRIAHPVKPSIFMPRSFSRLMLEITDVRVERVQDISHRGIEAEGVLPANICGGELRVLQNEYFRPRWDSLNAKRGFGWDVNPWVWVLAFTRVTP